MTENRFADAPHSDLGHDANPSRGAVAAGTSAPPHADMGAQKPPALGTDRRGEKRASGMVAMLALVVLAALTVVFVWIGG